MSSEAESRPFLKSISPDHHSGPSRNHTRIPLPKRLSWPWLSQMINSSHCITILITSIFWGLFLLVLLVGIPYPYPYQDDSAPKPSFKTTKWHPNNAAIYGAFFGNFELVGDCGTTPDEARRAGCKYDILSNHWVPAPCLDEGAIAEYQRDGSWFGYADSNRTQALTADEMGSMREGFYYTTMRDHIVHCASLWKKQFRAFAEERAALDWVVADEEHTMHCAQFLVDMTETERGGDYRNMSIKVFVGYAPCWVRER